MFSRWPSVCLSILQSVRTSFPFDNLSIYKRISFKFRICICIKNVSLGIVNGQISIIYGTCRWSKNGVWPLVPLLFGVS